MNLSQKIVTALCVLYLSLNFTNSAKINTPRVLLPWLENLYVNFTFEIIEGGCYSWSLSRDDIIDIEPLYDDSWGHCSRAARVSVSKTCVPPGSVIILAEEVNTGEVLRGDVDIDKISFLKVTSTTWKLYLEEAPEAFEVVAYDEQGNTFSTLEGIGFQWTIENLGNTVGEDPLVTLVRWSDTDYEAPHRVTELEAQGVRSYTVLLYGQAMGDCRVTVCLENICTDFTLQVVASVVLTPATASIAGGDTVRYKVVQARAGRLTIQNVEDTLYHIAVPDTSIASLDDSISLVKGSKLGTTTVLLMSGSTEVSTATLTVAEPYSIKVFLRPSSLLIRGEQFLVHCIVQDKNGHALTAGDRLLIRLTVDGEANVDLLKSTENGTITDAVAQDSGPLMITARLFSIAGRTLSKKVEGYVSAVAVDPLEVVPPELFVAWTESIMEIPLKHRGGGEEPVSWKEAEDDQQRQHNVLSLSNIGVATVRGIGEMRVRVHLTAHTHVQAYGRVWSAIPEYLQVSSTGQARVGTPHFLHVALTGTHPETGELFNFHRCDCGSLAVSLLEGPEPHNVTAAAHMTPVDGACCVLSATWSARGVCHVHVSRAQAADTARVNVRAAPQLEWPPGSVAALNTATLPVLALGESLVPQSVDARVAELSYRDGLIPDRYPDMQLFTLKCRKKGDTRLALMTDAGGERESVVLEVACAPHVSRIRLEPPETPGNCSGGPKLWLRPDQEVKIKVTLLDAIGRELLDERGPKATWEINPKHVGIEYIYMDRLFVETHPNYAPVPVPYKYYQLVSAEKHAIGWTGNLKVSMPDATASIQAKVVAPLLVDPLRANVAWETENIVNIASVTGGSGRYTVESAKGISATVEDGQLNAIVPGPGSYDLLVVDMCVPDEQQYVELHIEEILTVEVSTAQAVCVGGCIPISALVKGVSHRYLKMSSLPEWHVSGNVQVKDGQLCGVKSGTGKVSARLGGVWSAEHEVLVFPPLSIIPAVSRLPISARLQLRHEGGPPSHLASLHYETPDSHVEISGSGVVYGLTIGRARVKLVARDIAFMEMTSAEASVEVVPISGLRVRSATQTLLVGSPTPLWLEADGLGPSVLHALQPPPLVTWTVRDGDARLYTTHLDDLLERSVAEGLSVRVVPMKPGIVTVDVRVRNMGQGADTRSWDSTIEILGITDIQTSIEGLPQTTHSADRISLAVGASVRLRSSPRSDWQAYTEGTFELTSSGELKALQPGYGVVVAQHKDDRNHIYRQSIIHVEVATPHYGTTHPATDDASIRLVLRNSVGRQLIAPHANVSVAPLSTHSKTSSQSALGKELLITGLDHQGAFLTVQGTAGGVTVTDEVWVTGFDQLSERIVAAVGSVICLDGTGWMSPPSVVLAELGGVTLAVLSKDGSTKHVLRAERPNRVVTVHQLALEKIEFLPGEWPSSMVPLTISASGLSGDMVLCSETQRQALFGVTVALPYACTTYAPHIAEPILDINEGQIGCSIIPGEPITDASQVELCAEIGISRTCTRVTLLPSVTVTPERVSLISPPATFTVYGHPKALKMVKVTPSPGLKLEQTLRSGELTVNVKSDDQTCGLGWVTVYSKMTAQEFKVDVDKECAAACGTLLDVVFSFLKPYLSTLVTIAAVGGAYMYVQSRFLNKTQVKMPIQPVHTILPPNSSPSPRSRSTWSRSPYSGNGPQAPIYGDATILPDTSFSPNTTRTNSRFL